MSSDLILFSGNANFQLSEQISTKLEVPLGKALVGNFSDGETRVELFRNIRGNDVFIIQPTCYPTNHNIMEALVLVDACTRASAKNITLVVPYFGYARQDRKTASRTPITAKLVAELFEAAGVDRLLTLELHNSAIQGFFNIPVDHLFAKPVFVDYFKQNPLADIIVVSPDAGGVERARALAKQFSCGIAIIDKRRDRPNDSAVMHIVGDVSHKNCLIVDDIVDTGGSLVKACESLLKAKARSVSAAITHPVLSGDAVSCIEKSNLHRLVVTDSIPLSVSARNCNKIVQISVDALFAEAIKRVHNLDSVSSLFI